MKTAQGGYKAMLRDRVPRTVDLALKWCKAKERWIEYVYYTYIWWIKEKDARDFQTRSILGIAKGNREFKFETTIEWNNLTKEEREYWEKVQEWVDWFEKGLTPIIESYKFHLRKGDSSEYTKLSICEAYLNKLTPEWQDKLYNHILNHILEYYV